MNNYLQDRLEANKKAIGKIYWLITRRSGYAVEILDALPGDRFIVKSNDGQEREVSIFDLRTLDERIIEDET